MSFFALAYEVSCRAGSEESSSGISDSPLSWVIRTLGSPASPAQETSAFYLRLSLAKSV